MSKSNRRKRHRVKPVNDMINYYTNILKIVADKRSRKSENEIFNALRALNDKGLNYKRDAIDALHAMSENKILNITKSESHKQKCDVQLAPLGDELVALSKNIEQGFTTYNDLIGIVKKKFVVEQDIINDELKAKLLSKNWKLEDIPFHNQWLEDHIYDYYPRLKAMSLQRLY